MQNKAEETADAEQLAFRPDYLRPDSGKHEPQVIVYLDAQKNVRVGMVASIWRGAVVKPDGSASRQMRTTRASPGVPPVLFVPLALLLNPQPYRIDAGRTTSTGLHCKD